MRDIKGLGPHVAIGGGSSNIEGAGAGITGGEDYIDVKPNLIEGHTP